MLLKKKNRPIYFKNWSASVHCMPKQFVAPKHLDELVELVKECRKENKTIRVVGSGHSFTPLVATSDVLISIEHLSGIERLDEAAQLVTVWGGTTLKDLGVLLHEAGYALENLGDINEQTIAGAVSTGTHGTGMAFGSLSTQIHHLTILTAEGELLQVSPSENKHLLKAAQLSLGLLGIIVKVTLKILPSYQLIGHSYRGNFASCLAQLPQLIKENRNFEFFWFPYTDIVQIKTSNEPKQAVIPKRSSSTFKKVVLENGLFYGLSEISRIFPSTAKMISHISALGVPTGTEVNDSHALYATPRLVKFNEMEYCVPKDQMANVLSDLAAIIEKYQIAVHFPIECRYVKRDDIWLSPAYERDAAYIAVHMYKGMPFQEYFEKVEAIFLAYHGRPHWAKMHGLSYTKLKAIYPKLDDFLKLRKQMDEEGMFLNEYLRDMFALY